MSDTSSLFARYYFSRPGFVGGTTTFHEMCARYLSGAHEILEIGAGPPNDTSTFLATLGRTVGVDVSDELRGNPALAEAHVFDGVTLPFADGRFDGCVSNYVLEHVDDVVAHFREVKRVLKPGGHYLFRTPNLLHYVALGSRLMPHVVHTLIANRLRNLPAEAHEPWPTHYHANTRGRVKALARAAGMEIVEVPMIEREPYYARSSRLLFWPMMAYERLVNSGEWGAPFRANIFGVLRKPR